MKTSNLTILLVSGLFISCTVTNNLYINDPVSLRKGKGDFYCGAGTGQKPKIDSISDEGDISFTNKLNIAPIISIGGQYGITDQLDLRYAVHLPYIVGGFGLRVGTQYSFFKSHTKFNMAIGTDLGFVIAKDSIRILGSSSPIAHNTNGAINADIFVPLAYNFGPKFRLIITPRLSLNQIYIRKNQYDSSSVKYNPLLSVITLGSKLNRIYLEFSVIYQQDSFYPNFGLSYMIFDND